MTKKQMPQLLQANRCKNESRVTVRSQVTMEEVWYWEREVKFPPKYQIKELKHTLIINNILQILSSSKQCFHLI